MTYYSYLASYVNSVSLISAESVQADSEDNFSYREVCHP